MRPHRIALLAFSGLVVACAAEVPAPLLTVEELASPAGQDSGEPFLSVGTDGVHMSWLQRAEEGGHQLLFAQYDGGGWGEPQRVVSSDRFFVNWADFPSITAGPDGALWAHWLERGSAGGYDYGVRVARSADGGRTWSEPWTPHDDSSPTEHGFVSHVAVGGDLGFVWLDGRRYADGPDGPATQEMALYFRTMGAQGPAAAEELIDARVCDCCQTDAALAESGPVVVYRDRSPTEIRDIYVMRRVDGIWTEGHPVHEDGWETGACPVNGPAVAARGADVAVAWFTAAQGTARVKVAFSDDSAESFGEPVTVDSGNPAGRVDLVMRDDGAVLVSWLERTGGEGAEVRVRRVTPEGRAGDPLAVSAASSERASGFPRMVATPAGDALLAWTDVGALVPQVRLALVRIEAP